MKGLFEHLRKIERAAYPEIYWGLQSVEDWDDLADYAEAQGPEDVKVITGEGWYFIYVLSSGEIVDFASKQALSLKELSEVFFAMKKDLAEREVSIDAREKTSYRLLKFLERRNRITILEDSPFTWGEEVFHAIKLVIA